MREYGYIELNLAEIDRNLP